MKTAYPVIIKEEAGCFLVYSPDFDINTFGDSVADAIVSARDAIGASGLALTLDLKQPLPTPTPANKVKLDGGLLSLVDIDFDAYQRANERRTIRKNVSLPSYLNEAADVAGLNCSQILQEGIRDRLGL